MNSEIAELIPLYVADQLSAEQRKRVDEALAEDESVRQELVFWQSAQQAIVTEQIPSPTEWGLARLKRTISQQAPQTQAVTPKTKSFWKPLALAASFMFVVQTAYWGTTYFQEEPYQTLSTVEYTDALQVMFADSVSEAELRDLLITLNGVIVNGPSALGIYTIRFDDIALAQEKLRQSELVIYVEISEN